MKKMFVLATVASLILASCSKNEDAPAYTKLPTELGVSIKNIGTKSLTTRAAATGETTGFVEANGKVNIFIEGVEAGAYTPKVVTYNLLGTTWNSPTGEANKIFLTGNKANVYGFYPWDATFDLATKTMTCDVPASQNFTASAATDYMYSTGSAADVPSVATPTPIPTLTEVSTVLPVGKPTYANLFFHHALCKVSFVVNKSSSYPQGISAGVVEKIEISNSSSIFSTAGTVNVATGVYTSTPAGNVNKLTLTGSKAATATNDIVADASKAVPQAFGLFAPVANLASTLVTFTIDGVPLAAKSLAGVAAWLPGNSYIYKVEVTPTELKITCEIVPWTTTVSDLGSIN